MDEMVNWIMTNEFSRTTYRCTTSLQHAVAPGLQLVVRTGLRDVTRTGSRATCCRLDALHHFGRISKEQHTKWNHSHAGIGRSGRSRIYSRTQHARTHATTLSTLNECSIERLACSRLHALVRSTSQSVSRMRANRMLGSRECIRESFRARVWLRNTGWAAACLRARGPSLRDGCRAICGRCTSVLSTLIKSTP